MSALKDWEDKNEVLLTRYFALPTTDENENRGSSSPAKPALITPDPLSMTRASISSLSDMMPMIQELLHESLTSFIQVSTSEDSRLKLYFFPQQLKTVTGKQSPPPQKKKKKKKLKQN